MGPASGQAAGEPELSSQNEAVSHMEGSPSTVEGEPSTPEATEPPESIPMAENAEESTDTIERSGVDVNAEPDVQAAGDSDPLDSQSVFLPADNDEGESSANEGLDDPSDPGESSPPQDEMPGRRIPPALSVREGGINGRSAAKWR